MSDNVPLTKKQMASMEKFLDKRFPQWSIHVTPDPRSSTGFVIDGSPIGEVVGHKEEVWRAAEEWFDSIGQPVTWGRPRYAE